MIGWYAGQIVEDSVWRERVTQPGTLQRALRIQATSAARHPSTFLLHRCG